MGQTFQVVVVEDDDLTRVTLSGRINACADLNVSEAHPDCASALAALSVKTPDVLLVDLDLPDGNGIDIIGRESRQHPDLPIMVISVFGDETHVVQAIQAGARGYLLKDSDSTEIGESIHQLLGGGSPISPAIARHLIKRFQLDEPRNDDGDPDDGNPDQVESTLSGRELEVLVLASKGFSYAETAEILALSVNTIASYTKRIYGKLEVSSRSEAVYEATRMGIMNKKANQFSAPPNGKKRGG